MSTDRTAATEPALPPAPRSTAVGPGRALVAVYGIFALAASARAGVQLATRAHEAPLAYGLSAFSAVVYCLATVALGRGTGRWRTVAWVAVGVELVGVVGVGALSLLAPDDFPDATVWSGFGAGYGYVPLLLPFLGLALLWRTRAPAQPQAWTGAGRDPAAQ